MSDLEGLHARRYEVLPGHTLLSTEKIKEWKQVAMDIQVARVGDLVFLQLADLPQMSFGPKTWSAILAAAAPKEQKAEMAYAIGLANIVLDRRSADPDDDLATLARNFLRALERLGEYSPPQHA